MYSESRKHLQVAISVRKEEMGQKALLDLPGNSLVGNCPMSMHCALPTSEGTPGAGKMLLLRPFQTAETNTQMRRSFEPLSV